MVNWRLYAAVCKLASKPCTIVDNKHACTAYLALGLHILQVFGTREAGARAGQAAARVGNDLQISILQSHTLQAQAMRWTHEAGGPAAAGWAAAAGSVAAAG